MRVGSAVRPSLRKVALRLGRGVSLREAVEYQLRLALTLVRKKEKQLVSAVNDVRDDDRAANGAAKLLAIEHRAGKALFVVEKVVRVKNRVPRVVVEGSVKVVGAALGDDADNAARVPAILGTILFSRTRNSEMASGLGLTITPLDSRSLLSPPSSK